MKTIAEIASEIGVTPQAIYLKLNAHGIDIHTLKSGEKKANAALYDDAAEMTIKELYRQKPVYDAYDYRNLQIKLTLLRRIVKTEQELKIKIQNELDVKISEIQNLSKLLDDKNKTIVDYQNKYESLKESISRYTFQVKKLLASEVVLIEEFKDATIGNK